MLKLWTAM